MRSFKEHTLQPSCSPLPPALQIRRQLRHTGRRRCSRGSGFPGAEEAADSPGVQAFKTTATDVAESQSVPGLFSLHFRRLRACVRARVLLMVLVSFECLGPSLSDRGRSHSGFALLLFCFFLSSWFFFRSHVLAHDFLTEAGHTAHRVQWLSSGTLHTQALPDMAV